MLTTNNSGQGLTNALLALQDGFGQSSTVTIALTAINFSRIGGNTFQLDGVSMTAPSININSVCSAAPTFLGTVPVQLPSGTTAQRPVAPAKGMIWYNTSLEAVEVFQGGGAGGWVQIT